MLPNISGGHTAYQNFVVTNLRKYYPNPDALALAGDGTPVVTSHRERKSSTYLSRKTFPVALRDSSIAGVSGFCDSIYLS